MIDHSYFIYDEVRKNADEAHNPEIRELARALCEEDGINPDQAVMGLRNDAIPRSGIPGLVPIYGPIGLMWEHYVRQALLAYTMLKEKSKE